MNDEQLLDSIPDFVSFETLLKATPSEESGDRFIYVEASKESLDQQGEIVLANALRESVDVFKKFGVVDIDHKSMPSIAKKYGIDRPEEWVIGRPIDVRFDGGTTFVKAQLRSGDSALAYRANSVWEGMTKIKPPDRYYASVGGSVLGREIRIDPKTKEKVAVITKTRWNNLALSLNPVNPDLNPAGIMPIGVFAKSLNGFVIAKALEAGYGTDSAQLSGGAALRKQSLHGSPIGYFDLRNRLSAALSEGELGKNPGIRELVAHCTQKFGLSHDEAAECVERFMRDLKRGLKNRQAIRSGGK